MIDLLGIELTTLFAFILLFLFGIVGYYSKISFGIITASAIAGFIIALLIAPYSQVVVGALSLSLWYGYDWTLQAVLGGVHMISMIIAVMVAGLNLYKSGGKIVWA